MSLTPLNLPDVVRTAAELTEFTVAYNPSDHAALIEAQNDPDPNHSACVEQQFAWHADLDRIVESANRLKRALGASGELNCASIRDDNGQPSWPNMQNTFENTIYKRDERIGLKRLANAAIDLSGFACVKHPQERLRQLGLKELNNGLRQLWPALTPGERKQVQPEITQLRRVFKWSGKPTADPPKYTGPTEITDEELFRVIDPNGFYTRDKEHIAAQQEFAAKIAQAAVPRGQERANAKSLPKDKGETQSPAIRAEKAFLEVMTPEEWAPIASRMKKRLELDIPILQAGIETANAELAKRGLYFDIRNSEHLEHLARMVGKEPGPMTAREIHACALAWYDAEAVKSRLIAEALRGAADAALPEKQRAILSALSGRALSLKALAKELDGCDPSQLQRCHLKPLMDSGRLKNERKIGGYYRPDAPPSMA